MKKQYLALIIAIILIIPFALAIEPSLTSNIINLAPYYSDGFNSGVIKQYNLTVNPPDGIMSVENAIIKFHTYILPTVTYTLKVNNQTCNTPTYTVSTTQASAGMSDLSFDCKNIINKIGKYNITLSANKNTGAITSTLELTYINNPKGTATVHGTEYEVGDPVKVWLQLLNSNLNVIEEASCFVDVYYPSGDLLFERALMQYTTGGIYEVNFIAPNILGVYPAVASCFYETSSITFLANSGTIVTGTNQANDYTVTQTSDSSRWQVNEALSGITQRVIKEFNFTNVTQPNLFTDLIIHWEGQWNGQAGDDLTFQIFNFSNSQWISLPNQVIAPTSGGDNIITNTLSFPTSTNLTAKGLIQNKVVRIRITDTANLDIISNRVQTDYINVMLHSLSNETWHEVKGSSEVHIRSPTGLNFHVTNLCGTRNNDVCGYFETDPTTENYFSPEGIIIENLTITNIANIEETTTFYHEEPQNIDCTAIYSITRILQNGSEEDITESIGYSLGSKNNCILQIPLELQQNISETKYSIMTDNYLKWEVIWNKDRVDSMNQTLSLYCNQLASQNNFIYNIPLNSSVQGNSDLAYCNRIMDDLYYFYTYYEESLEIESTQEYLSPYFETQFYTTPIYQHFFKIASEVNKQNIIQNNILLAQINQTINSLNDTAILEKLSLMNQTMTSQFTNMSSSMIYQMNLMQQNMTTEMSQMMQNVTNIIQVAKMSIHGTEYTFGQVSKAWLQLLEPNGQTAINNAVCYIDIYNPDMTHLVDTTQMINLNHEGIYYYDITLPEVEGVYSVIAHCYYQSVQTIKFFDQYQILNGTDGAGTLADMQTVDGNFKRIAEANFGGTRRVITEFNVTNMNSCINISESLLQSISIESVTRFNSATGDNINFSIFNYTSNSFVNLPNFLAPTGTFTSVVNTLFTNNITKLNITRPDGTGLRIRLSDTNVTDGANTNLDLDQLVLSCNQLGNSTYQEVKGSSEMHLNNNTNQILLDQFEQWLITNNLQYLNLSGQLNNLTNTSNQILNITQENNNWLQQIWNYLQGLGITIFNMNQTINQINNTVNNIAFNTNSTPHVATITANQTSCISESNWIIKATVKDQYGNNYPNALCTINTTVFGFDNMTYTPSTLTYDFQDVCPSPTNWTFVIDCN